MNDRNLNLSISPGNHKKLKSPSAFLLDFPMRTNYMYARMKRSVVNEIFALTICLWVKAGTGPGLGTPFSYAVPGQANELVLIEWGSNPMELLINDKVKLLQITLSRHIVPLFVMVPAGSGTENTGSTECLRIKHSMKFLQRDFTF